MVQCVAFKYAYASFRMFIRSLRFSSRISLIGKREQLGIGLGAMVDH
jgi:hypothetical protein